MKKVEQATCLLKEIRQGCLSHQQVKKSSGGLQTSRKGILR